jgi:uncharacterized tellurite resistance protein B-like protein
MIEIGRRRARQRARSGYQIAPRMIKRQGAATRNPNSKAHCRTRAPIMNLWKLFGIERPPSEVESKPHSDTLRKIIEELDHLEEDRAKHLAAFAYILGRVAHADLSISDEETREMERIVAGMGGLPEEQAILVVQLAKTQNKLFGSTDNFVVTREFRNTATRAQKLSLLTCLFAVSSSDQSISNAEDNEIRRISIELGLDHIDFVAARSAYKQHLEVLKNH